jgi:hypothetical protein
MREKQVEVEQKIKKATTEFLQSSLSKTFEIVVSNWVLAGLPGGVEDGLFRLFWYLCGQHKRFLQRQRSLTLLHGLFASSPLVVAAKS